MSGVIDVAEIHGQEGRPSFNREVQQTQNAIHSIRVWNLPVVRLPVSRPPPTDLSLRSGKEKRRGHLPLLLSGNPEGFSKPPSAVSNFLPVAHHENRIK